MTELLHLTVGQNVKAQLESDLKLEIAAVDMYNRAVQVCREEGDNASRELFERLLKDEEEHVDWLEAQMHQIHEISYDTLSGPTNQRRFLRTVARAANQG